MGRGLGKFVRGNIHLKNDTISTNDRYILSARSFNRLGSADSPFPRKYDVYVLEFAGLAVRTNQPDPIRSRTEKIELLRGWVGDEAAGAAVAQMHGPPQKVAGLSVEGGEQERIRVFRFGRVYQDAQRQPIAGNRHG